MVASQMEPTTFVAGRDDRPFRHSHSPIDHSALVQSRETGDVIPDDTFVQGEVKALPFAKSWVHMFAGGYVSRRIYESLISWMDADKLP